ncbi:hypothetical protein [Luteimonas wenzhouensis]|uniref:Uncharacterized protein n=1 Tax=Luteimonas wenzhouensis TaxID=2599615 RepID=A0A5C5U5M8_9GAMM|nr:hypothetical protein [Luteimonas wenzhouensis]TWT21643.1 hypothetical protein FQY79_00445 [Luteimonas wenzhouensis]
MNAKDKGASGLPLDLAGVDFFTKARGVLNDRWRELSEKYQVDGGFSYSQVAAANDTLEQLFRGQIDRDKFREAIEDAVDIILLSHVQSLDKNEKNAASDLHGHIVGTLRINALTPAMTELLVAMHAALRLGLPADAATLTKPPSGRPSNAERDRAVIRYMQGEDRMRELMAAAGTPGAWRSKAESYKEAARIFGLSVKTIRNICARS